MSQRAIVSDFDSVLTTPLGNSFAAWSKESGIALEDLGKAIAASMERHSAHPLQPSHRSWASSHASAPERSPPSSESDTASLCVARAPK